MRTTPPSAGAVAGLANKPVDPTQAVTTMENSVHKSSVLPIATRLRDASVYTFFRPGDGLEEVVSHLGLGATAASEGWAGALVGDGSVWISPIDSAVLRRPADYERCFRTIEGKGEVDREFASHEIALRLQLRRKVEECLGYYVNLDERGSFRADVRNALDRSVYEVLGGNELEGDDSGLVDDGFMRNFGDLDGLTTHLRNVGVISSSARILSAEQHGRRLENMAEEIRLSAKPVFATQVPNVDAIKGIVAARQERELAHDSAYGTTRSSQRDGDRS